MKTDKEILADLIEFLKSATGKTQNQLSVEAGYGPNTLAQMKSKADGHAPVLAQLKMVFKEVLKNSIFAVPRGGHDKSTDYTPDVAGSMKDLTMQALVNLTESNKLLAESNKSLARSHEELVMMTKEKRREATADGDRQNLVDVGATVMVMRDFLLELYADKTGKTKHQAEIDLNTKVEARKNPGAHKGIAGRTGDGKKSIL